LRGSGLVGLASIVTSLLPLPAVSDLATFFSLALFVNGPYSPLLTPVGFEPILLAYGKLYSPVAVALLGVLAQVLVEYVNYHLYDAALRTETLRPVCETRLLRRVLGWYQAAPFLTTVVVAFTPLPYWPVRITAPLARYPVRLHLAATVVGRLPRLWFFAAVGRLLPFSGGAILGAGLGLCALFAAVTVARQRRGHTPISAAGVMP
jgi:membrane protein YqaA with SNARE-associated domain